MSDILDLLKRLEALDIRLALDGERLTVNAPKGALGPQLREEVSGRKEEIKAHLRVHGSPARSASAAGITRVPRLAEMPVSHTQQRLWFLKQLDPQSSAYNIPSVIRMAGRLDVAAMERTLADIVARHESLRTRFVEVNGDPRCIIEPQATLRLEVADVGRFPEAQRYEQAMQMTQAFAREPFDLHKCPLLRAMLVRVGPELHVFSLVLHHIIADGISIAILSNEFRALYTGHVSGAPANLPPLQIQYIDFSEWQRKWFAAGEIDRQLAFWRKQLGGSLPVLKLPTDRPRPRIQTSEGARVSLLLPPAWVAALKQFGRSEGVTPFMVLLGAFDLLLQRYTGATDVLVGTAIANRNRAETEAIVGFFANNIVLRTDLSGDPTVRELLGRVKDMALNAYAHQDMPFDLLVSELVTTRDLDRSPLVQVMFNLSSLGQTRMRLPGLDCEPINSELGVARFELTADLFDTPDGLLISFEYNTAVFDAATIERMLGHYRMLLEEMQKAPAARVADLPMLASAERDRVLVDWNRTGDATRSGQNTVHGLFEQQAALRPHAQAALFEGASLSYAQLDARANQLARHLQGLGVGVETLVGVWMDRSLDMIVAMLGVLKAGGAYVPLDPAFPKDRIDFMVADAALAVVVTQERLADKLPATLRAVCIDTDWSTIATQSAESLAQLAGPKNVAYVIYTSGSTGRPKGVQVEHRSVVNFLASMHREPGITPDDRFVAVTTLSFDIAGLEIHGPLTAGGTVVLASRATALDGHSLISLLEESGATILQATPATWRVLLESGWGGIPRLKMLCGGEALPRELADRLLALGGELWNMYGPTETTIWSTLSRVEAGAAAPGIGKPIANTQVYILDAKRQPVPIGVPGELYIAGDGLARGYLNRTELTQERFVPSPFVTGARMYRTGDLARWRPDGTLECLGRADDQVKIRGYRIEPGEIETALAKHEAVAQGVVVAREDGTGELSLVAYVVARPGTAPEPAQLRRFLSTTLPDYMVPTVFVKVESLPLTPNGKVDRKALPAPVGDALLASNEFVSPATQTEMAVAEVWRNVLRRERIGRNDNFFDLGGHSLLLVQVQSRLAQSSGRKLMLLDLFQYPTVASLAEFLDASGHSAAAVRPVAARVQAG